jgi:hypothetical protein
LWWLGFPELCTSHDRWGVDLLRPQLLHRPFGFLNLPQ